MGEVHDLRQSQREIAEIKERLAKRGGPPENPTMDINERVAGLEARFDALVPTLATKEDLQRELAQVRSAINEQTWKIVGWVTIAGGLLVAAVYSISRHSY